MVADFSQVPERRLLVAVINRALFDYVGQQQEEQEAAADWMFGDEDSSVEFSFPWVCAQLNLDPESVLSRVRRMTRDPKKPTQQWFSELQRAVNY